MSHFRTRALPIASLRARIIRRRHAVLTPVVLALLGLAPAALATPGSGTAVITPPGDVEAGSLGTWTIDYTAAEDFALLTGGVVVVTIPAGWTDPVAGPLVVPGHVEAEGPPGCMVSLSVNGRDVTLTAGSFPGVGVFANDHLLIHYGSPAPAGRAQAQTNAPATAAFAVASDPAGVAPAPLAAGSPQVTVIPADPSLLAWQPASVALVAGIATPVRLEARDPFGNLSGPKNAQLLSLTSASPTLRVLVGGVPVSEVVFPADSTGIDLEVRETIVGSGVTLRAADGDGVPPPLAAGLASVTTSPGVATTLSVRGIQDPLDAGAPASVVVEALDAFGNRATGYSGTVGFSTSDTGSATQLPADYTFTAGDQGIHLFTGVVLTTSGEQMVGAEDRADSQISGRQTGITIVPGPAVDLAVFGIDDPAVAGQASDVSVEARDTFGNRAAGYLGTVQFATDDSHPGVVIPGDYSFAAADSGRHDFPGGVVLMTAGVHQVTAADRDAPAIAGAQSGIDVGPGVPATAVMSPPGTVPVTVGATQGIVLTVRDAAGNPVPDETATIALVDSPDGALAPDPNHPGGTQGSATVQSGRTDAAGRLSVLYNAPVAAGLVDSLDGWTATIGAGSVDGIALISTAAGATRLAILPAGAIADTAMAAIALLVQAEDSFGNVDPSATTLVRLTATSPSARFSINGGTSWSSGSADSLALVAGTTGNRLRVRDSVAGLIGIDATDPAGFLIAASRNDLTIRPALPAGVIPLAVVPDTLTADGRSQAAASGGPVADRYGNPVGGMPVTVDAPPGEVVAVDEDPAPGIQRHTDAAGRFAFSVRAADFPATAQVSAASGPAPDQGTAAGVTSLVFAPRVRLDLLPGSLVPPGAVPGDTVAFSITVRNLGPTAATFGGATVIRFSDPGGATYASALASPVTVGAGGTAPLVFAAERLDPLLDPGWYTPLLTLSGTDSRGAAIDTLIAADLNPFGLEAAELVSVVAPARVSRGQVGAAVQVVILNRGEVPIPVTGLGLDFSEAAYAQRGVVPTLPDSLPGHAQRTYTVTVDVDPLATLGPVAIDAHAQLEIGGRTRSVAGAGNPTSWIVETGASLAYAAGSLGPRFVSSGQTHPAGVVINNSGAAEVILDPALTRIVFGHPGNDFVSPLASPTVVSGNGSTALRFADVTVPPAAPPGMVPVRVFLGGDENGAAYSGTFVLGDSLRIFAPAILGTAAGSFAPDSVSLGQVRSFSLDVVNSGGAGISLRPGTVLRLSGAVTVDCPLAAIPPLIPAGGRQTLLFGPSTVDPALGSGALPVTVLALTRENGIDSSAALPVAEPLVAQNPAALRWVAASLTPSRVTRGVPASFRLDIANDGQAEIGVGAGTRLIVTDGTDSLAVTYSGPMRVVPGGGSVSLVFPSQQVPAALAAQNYAPVLAVVALENHVPSTVMVAAPSNELVVEAPADLRYLAGTLAPDVAVVGGTVSFRLVLENRGGAGGRPSAATDLVFAGFDALIDSLLSPVEIPGGAADTLIFRSASLAGVGAGSHSPVVGLRGHDRNGTPIDIDIDVAPDAVTVLTGAALRVTGLTSTAPRGARVNRGQSIPLALRVTNPGEEAVAGAMITAQGAGLASPVSAPLGTLAGGDTVAVAISGIVANTVGNALVRATLSGGAGVVSGAPPLVLPAADDTLSLLIMRPATLAASLTIVSPAGATDGVASGGSLLDLQATVANTGDAPIDDGGTIALQVPAGYGILGSAAARFAAGVPLAFAVAVPPGAAAPDSIVALIADVPLDLNSGASAQISVPRAARAIETVNAARLRLAASIVEPPEARDGTALPGQTVTIEGIVTNIGTAAAPGSGLLSLTLDPELALAPGEPSDRPFTVGQPVRFQIVAEDRPGPPRPLSLAITSAPPDENTGVPAAVDRPEAGLGLATIARAAELSGRAAAASDPSPVLRGGVPRPVLVITVANPAPPTPEQTIELTGMAPELLRSSGGGGGAVDPAEVLSRLELRRDRADGPLVAEWTGSGAPRLAFIDTLGGLETHTYVLALAARPGAPPGSYRAALGNPSTLSARDPATREAVPVLLVGGAIESAPFALYEGPHAAPNPFGPGRESARLAYVLEQDSKVDIEVFTLVGDRVWSKSVSAGDPGGRAGLNQVAWDGRNASGQLVRNGVYHCRIHGGGLDAMVKIAAIR